MATATIAARTSVTRVVFDGQSLNQQPGFPYNMPSVVMLGRGVPYKLVAVGGMAWTPDLWPSRFTRCFSQATIAQNPILVMTGGTSDVWNHDTATSMYTDMTAYANDARTGGFRKVLASTIVVSTQFNSSDETQRQAVNTMIVANTGGFDGVCDMASDTRLQNALDTTYYVDGTHWTQAGAAVAASYVTPVLLPFLI